MSNHGLEFTTAVNLIEILNALDYGKRNLSREAYKAVVENLKEMIKHILLWILISVVIGSVIAVSGYYVSDKKQKDLLEANNATGWVSGVRVNATTIQFTRGETYKYDVAVMGIDLNSDFPNQHSLILLIDDNNQLKAVISNDEFDKIDNIFIVGIVLGLISAIVILVICIIYMQNKSSYAKKWYEFIRWANLQ